MPRKIRPRKCACGCGATTRGGNFLPGHDARTLSAVVSSVGGVAALRTLVEKVLNRRIEVETE